jgi:hypothetical protein
LISYFPHLSKNRINEAVTVSKNQNSDLGSYLTGYDDFTPSWYTVEGSSILLGMYTRIVIIGYGFLMRYYLPRICRAYDRRFTNNLMVTRQATHKRYINKYKNSTFDVYLSYAEILNVIVIACTYGIILPHIWLPSLLTLCMIYYKDKILSKKIHLNFASNFNRPHYI